MELKGGKKEREREKGILVKNGQPAREDSLGLRRELRPCSARDLSLSLSLYTPLRRTVSLKRCIKLRVHRESGNYWRCSPRICVECSLAMFSSG